MAGKAQYKNQWQKENYDRVNLTLPKGRKAEFSAHAETRGESLNAFIGRAMVETLERDTSQKPSESPLRAASPLEGIITPTTLKAAQKAAEATGEDMPAFMARSVERTVRCDEITWSLGINPATGEEATKGGNERRQKRMSAREMAKNLIDQIPESRLYYVISYLQGAATPDETPNAETLEAFAEIENGGGTLFSGSAADFVAMLQEED